MTTALVILTASAALIAAIALIMTRRRMSVPVRAVVSSDGHQEATITVSGRYRPDSIRVLKGTPVRLHFVRKEDDPCSERVIISGVGLDRRLPAFQSTTVEFVPRSAGVFLFTCQWGMYRGRLEVLEPDGKSGARRQIGSGDARGLKSTTKRFEGDPPRALK